jgi:hypothetical protein
MDIYSMVNSNSKVSPKSDNINNAEKTAKPGSAESAARTDSSAKVV